MKTITSAQVRPALHTCPECLTERLPLDANGCMHCGRALATASGDTPDNPSKPRT